MQGEEKDPATEGNRTELPRGLQLALVQRLCAARDQAILLEGQHFHADDPACRPPKIYQSW